MNKSAVIFFVFVLMIGCIVLNWNSVSWIFNYRVMSDLTYDFFNPYQDSNIFAKIKGSVDTKNIDHSSKYSLMIPSIGLFTPVVIAKNSDIKTLNNALDNGAVYYPGSVLPGQNGQIVILGHSAPINWPYIKHDWIFNDLQNLRAGDKITLKYEDAEYTYSIVGKNIVQPGQDVSAPGLSKNNNILTLVSCWPPGGDEQRIVVTAELI